MQIQQIYYKLKKILSDKRFLLIHSFKITLACVISHWLEKFIASPSEQLVVISTLLVMIGQPDFGSLLNKSFFRLLGSAAGGILAILLLPLWNKGNIIDSMVFAVSIFGLSLFINEFRKYRAGGILGMLTFVLVLLHPHPTIHTSTRRLEEILLGIIVAILVSGLVFPLKTQSRLKDNLSMTLNKLKKLYSIKFCDVAHTKHLTKTNSLEGSILSLIGNQFVLSSATLIASKEKEKLVDIYGKIVSHERGILRATLFLDRMMHLYIKNHGNITQASVFDVFHQNVVQILTQFATDFRAQQTTIEQLNDSIKKLSALLNNQNNYKLHSCIDSCTYLAHELTQLSSILLQV